MVSAPKRTLYQSQLMKGRSMGASATVTIPLSIRSSVDADEALTVLTNTAGSSSASVDPAAGTGTVVMQMPGNIDALMAKLASHKLLPGDWITVSVPVRSLAIPGYTIDTAALTAKLLASPAVTAATINGDKIEATVAAETASMRFMYEEILHAGMIPQDVPTLVYLRGL
jgi:hypothetical protein